ncbi:DUF2358 domain containing protein [Trichuris trichiura]|uniref:DUF2358 domain containing protein n=1 Tax=Trichuris trichiura TaxID=36087 RepID=A0A077YX12_TRITR|nr:DUF2358 domain containing protein [Trichuris trichiura]
MKAKQSALTLDDTHLVCRRSFRPPSLLLQADPFCSKHLKSTAISKGGILSPILFPRDSFAQFSSVQPTRSSPDKQRTPVPFYERGKPNWDQLQHVIYRLNETVPWFFQRQLDLTFYAEDVLFTNRIHGTEVQGLRHYWIYLGTLTLMYRVPCPYIEMKVISCHPIVDEGVVSLRWRAQYLGILEFLTVTARARSTDIEVYRKHSRWFDGVSSFYVGADGLVYKHVADRVMRDPDEYESGKRKFGLLSKIFGFSPKPSGAIA